MEDNEMMQIENIDADDSLAEITDAGEKGMEDKSSEKSADDVFIFEESDHDSKDDGDAEPSGSEAGEKLFHLKHFDDEFDADEKTVVELAQKGIDYDRIRSRWEKAEAENRKSSAELAFLNELAADAGMSVHDFMDSTRAKKIMEKSELGENEAKALAKYMRDRADETERLRNNREKLWGDFSDAYPDVKVSSLPKSVINSGVREGNLVRAYEAYMYRRSTAEKAEAAKTEMNRKRSTGSRKSVGAGDNRSEFDSLWYDGT